MEPNKKLTPLFFFLSVGSVAALIVSVTAFLNLAFETLNFALPDVLTDSFRYGYANYSYDGVRGALALLIIVFPIYLVLEHYWVKAEKKETISQWDAIIRRWAIYLILFLASITVIADLVVLVRYFVSGEITTRFVLKVLITLLAAVMVGGYYIARLIGKEQIWTFRIKLWAPIKASILVLALIVVSFSVIGSPMKQRSLRLDDRRLQDLQSIQWQVISYWQQKEKLPETLAELSNPISSYAVPQDPEFQKGKAYEYQKLDDMKFAVCATFTLPMPKGWVPGGSYGYGGGGMMGGVARDVAVTSVAPMPGGQNESWDHEAGRTCFERTIDPDLYPPYPKTEKALR